MEGRDSSGRFVPGNPGGPGRPPRATERAYLAVLGDAISLEDWRQIVDRAKADALAGDPKAREWLAKHLLGKEPPKLIDLAAVELLGVDPDQEVHNRAAEVHQYLSLTQALLGQ